MVNIILIFIAIYFFVKVLNKLAPRPTMIQVVKSTCPPHSWSWQDVYNEDGSTHHRHLVCAKCGPLHGVSNEKN